MHLKVLLAMPLWLGVVASVPLDIQLAHPNGRLELEQVMSMITEKDFVIPSAHAFDLAPNAAIANLSSLGLAPGALGISIQLPSANPLGK